ncbi:MAG: fimbrial protein [Rhodoferax sp.]|nr:fimbrial protein [Rhodoferax sp.]
MIRLNLLPHRERARLRRARAWRLGLVLSGLAGLTAAGVVYAGLSAELALQRGLNVALSQEIAQFDRQIKDGATVATDLASLRIRQRALEDLQSERNVPVHVLNRLVRLLPDGVRLTGLRQDPRMLQLQGSAASNERVSELLKRLSDAADGFARPELVEVVAGTGLVSPREQRRVVNFTVRVPIEPAAFDRGQRP